MASDWIDTASRMPREGETITLPDIKGVYEFHGTALYEKGKLAIPIGIVEKYRIYEQGQESGG